MRCHRIEIHVSCWNLDVPYCIVGFNVNLLCVMDGRLATACLSLTVHAIGLESWNTLVLPTMLLHDAWMCLRTHQVSATTLEATTSCELLETSEVHGKAGLPFVDSTCGMPACVQGLSRPVQLH